MRVCAADGCDVSIDDRSSRTKFCSERCRSRTTKQRMLADPEKRERANARARERRRSDPDFARRNNERKQARLAADPAARKRKNAQDRARYAARTLEKIERDRERSRQMRGEPIRITSADLAEARPADSARELWNRAHPNSALRRRFDSIPKEAALYEWDQAELEGRFRRGFPRNGHLINFLGRVYA